MIADRPMVVDGVEYVKGEEIWDLGSNICVSNEGMKRNYVGLSKDFAKLPKYVNSGSTATMLDTSDMYIFLESDSTWYKKKVDESGVTPEQIQEAVDNYLQDNPVSAIPSSIDHGTNDTTFTLPPNEVHHWGEVTSLAITLDTGKEVAGKENVYEFWFVSGYTPTVLSFSKDIKGVPVVDTNSIYQISIQNNCIAYGRWDTGA